MKPTIALLTSLTLAVLAAAALANAAEPPAKPQTTCPVSGEDIDKKVSLDWQGQRVYFCCPKCVAAFKKNPDTYFAKLAAEGVVPESVQTTDPVCGMDQKPEGIHADYKGRRVYFCSEYCKGAFEKEPLKYLDQLPGQQAAK